MAEDQGNAAAIIDLEEMKTKALRVVMEIFKKCIIYQRDKPDEARIMLFPAFLHISMETVEAEVKARYAQTPSLLNKDQEKLTEDERIVKEGVDDAIAILRAKTANSFPMPGVRELEEYELQSLTELAHVETTTFYRIQMKDVIMGFIPLARTQDGKEYRLKVGQPPGTRIRHWGTAIKMAEMFMAILVDESLNLEEKIDAMLAHDLAEDMKYSQWLLRLRQRGLLGAKGGN